MAAVDFWTPVTYQPFVPSLGRRILENVDAYFCRDGIKVCVIPGHEKGYSEGVVQFDEQPSRTTLKVISYWTIIIPALVFIAKVVLRYTYTFHLITEINSSAKPPPFIGCSNVPPASASSPPEEPPTSHDTPVLLHLDRKYRLSLVEVARLFIRVPILNRDHDLSQINSAYYRVPPSVNIGFSVLPEYQDSYFEYEYCKSISSGLEIEIVRRTKAPFLDPDFLEVETLLTNEQIIDLKLIQASERLTFSVREEFNGFYFRVRADEGGFWVQKLPADRSYPFLPFNRAVQLKHEDAEKLRIAAGEIVEFEGWTVLRSDIPEYANSVLLIKETRGSSICVRMLKP